MDVAKAFMLGLMTLLIIGVVILIVMTSISDTSLALDSFTISNETTFINATLDSLDQASVYGFSSLSISEARTNTGIVIPTANYTVTSAGVITNTTVSAYTSAAVDYTYKANNEIVSVTDNSSTGVVSFFSSTTTWLSLLGVVIIILIIAIVISVVSRFDMGSRKESGGVTF